MAFNSTSERLSSEEVMAERIYFFGQEPQRRVSVRIGFPTWRPTESRAVCNVEIDEGNCLSVRPVNGADGFEAVQLSLILIGTVLKSILEESGGAVTWSDGRRDDLAFPTYPDYSLAPIMESTSH